MHCVCMPASATLLITKKTAKREQLREESQQWRHIIRKEGRRDRERTLSVDLIEVQNVNGLECQPASYKAPWLLIRCYLYRHGHALAFTVQLAIQLKVNNVLCLCYLVRKKSLEMSNLSSRSFSISFSLHRYTVMRCQIGPTCAV